MQLPKHQPHNASFPLVMMNFLSRSFDIYLDYNKLLFCEFSRMYLTKPQHNTINFHFHHRLITNSIQIYKIRSLNILKTTQSIRRQFSKVMNIQTMRILLKIL
ncbi:unnamed protein product [Meloidogyne enterolobii]|uniref:Uncharacterized protein n=1 Tax=Meloidogyne enterolobii TaxID=390850 RepID=A0ACB1AN45_MELEN